MGAPDANGAGMSLNPLGISINRLYPSQTKGIPPV